MIKIMTTIVLLGLGACSATYVEPTLVADHPANIAAPEAPLPERSRTLDLAATEPITPTMMLTDSTTPDGEQQTGHVDDPPASESRPSLPAPAAYACPMHPEIVSDKPDQRCPKCNMKLKRQDRGTEP